MVIGSRMVDVLTFKMGEHLLKSELVVKSATVLAMKNGIPIFISKKGDPEAGSIIIKIDTLDGKITLLRRHVNFSLKKNKSFISFVNLFGNKIASNSEINNKINAEIKIDPDCWVVEIEDKKGINYFEKLEKSYFD